MMLRDLVSLGHVAGIVASKILPVSFFEILLWLVNYFDIVQHFDKKQF